MNDVRKLGRRLVMGILFLVLGFPLLQTACDPATLARMQTNLKENLENRVEELPGEPASDAGTPLALDVYDTDPRRTEPIPRMETTPMKNAREANEAKLRAEEQATRERLARKANEAKLPREARGR